jgi:hypothetical protein
MKWFFAVASLATSITFVYMSAENRNPELMTIALICTIGYCILDKLDEIKEKLNE